MILVSACVMGKNCRYDGKNCANQKVIDYLKDKEYQLICPEMMGHLPCPRKPSERVQERIINSEGIDVTEAFYEGARKTLELAIKLQPECIILQEKSPSCGLHKIYDGTFSGKLIQGQGLTAQLLSENGFHVLSSEDFV